MVGVGMETLHEPEPTVAMMSQVFSTRCEKVPMPPLTAEQGMVR
jgi:hypothetical protein